MKTTTAILTFGAAMTAALFAGTTSPVMTSNSCEAIDAFASARRPISNPTLFDLALPRTNAHAIFIHQQMPNSVAIAGGGSLPVGGDFQVYALQLEYALNERLSIVATKDGYVDFNPDATLSEEEGFANLAAGLKYAFIYQPENGFALSGTTTIEIPTGDSDVTQGNGDGAVNLILSALKIDGEWQFAGGAGVHVPFDNDAESMTSFVSAHVSYEVCQYFTPLIELNWYHVLNEGDGGSRYSAQAGGALPGLIGFEGGDLLNWGAANSKDNADIVTLAAGFRSRLSENIDCGIAYEIPLTDEQENLMESRITIDLIWNF
jgi:Putative MetA-pathway of phenol degradation